MRKSASRLALILAVALGLGFAVRSTLASKQPSPSKVTGQPGIAQSHPAVAHALVADTRGPAWPGTRRREFPREPAMGSKVRLAEGYGRLPLTFEANQGQTDPQVKFLARGRGYTLFLTGTEAVLALNQPQRARRESFMPSSAPSASSAVQLRLPLLGANPQPEVRGLDELPGKSNYFIGNDPSKWRTNVPTYGRVEYRNVYPGINLVHYGNQRQLEYDFVVAPGADPRAIKFEVEGAERIEIDEGGDLVMHVAGDEVRQHKPLVYQEVGGVYREIAGRFLLRVPGPQSAIRSPKSEIGFEIGPYDPGQTLVIDPVLVYSTYLGGGGEDWGFGIAVDSAGNAYVTGRTGSTNFPTASPLQPTYGSGTHDVFVAKLNAAGSALLYSTYLGGSGDDDARGIAVDAAGSAYVTGYTTSSNFPTASPLQPANGGGDNDAFVAKLNPGGSALVYSTYLGGSGEDGGQGIAVDSSGNAYVAGWTRSTNFPTASPLQPAWGGGDWSAFDAFVAKLNAAGSALVYSTYLGGTGSDYGFAISVDSSGNAYVAGATPSTNFPTANPLQATNAGGWSDAFVAKLNPAGSALLYSTYLGGSGEDVGSGIAVDSSGNAYVTGFTKSYNFPTVGPLQPAHGGWACCDAFAAKLNAAGSALVYSTYLGGSGEDFGQGIAVDSSGNAYVTGRTYSTNFPTASPLQAAYGGWVFDAFVAKLNPAGSALVYSTYLGGSGDDMGLGIAVDSASNAYVTGSTGSTNFPTASPLQTAYGGGTYDAFVAKIATNRPPVANAGPGQTAACSSPAGTPVALSGSGSDPDNDTLSFVWKNAAGNLVGNTAAVNLTLPLGSQTFTLTVDDGKGGTASDTVTVVVRDTTPPALTLARTSMTVVLPTATATGATASLSGIASATDACCATVTITNNAPALFPMGLTQVTFTATDASGNYSHRQMTVQVVYKFIGFLPPVPSDGSGVFNAGRTIPLKFQLAAADGSLVTTATATLQVFKATGQAIPPEPSGGSNTGNLFRFDPASSQYIYNLSTAGYAAGTYLLRVTLNDQSTHDVQVSLR